VKRRIKYCTLSFKVKELTSLAFGACCFGFNPKDFSAQVCYFLFEELLIENFEKL
jgi:hypothetical protein